MDAALNGVLGSLPADTKVYDGHNYTQGEINQCDFIISAKSALNRICGFWFIDRCVADRSPYWMAKLKYGRKDPNNEALKKLKADVEASGETTGKYNIADERKHNVFMRLTSEAVLEKTKAKTPVEAIGKLREMKNNFKG